MKNKSKRNEMTCTFYVNGERVEKLTEEHLNWMSERLSERMSQYFTAHPEEYEVLLRHG